MASTRVNFAAAAVLLIAAVLSGGIKGSSRIALLVLLGVIGTVAVSNDRFSRFKSLGDQDAVMDRVDGSVNRTFWEIAEQYPMGNGLGGGGTSVPFFLADLIRKPVSMESEYARILLEQGLLGLGLWATFICSLVFAPKAFMRSPWRPGRFLCWLTCCISFGCAGMGTGLMTSIPQTAFIMLAAGWVLVPAAPESRPSNWTPKSLLSYAPLSGEPWGQEHEVLPRPQGFSLDAGEEFAR